MFTLGSPCLSRGLIVPFNCLPTGSCLLFQIAHARRLYLCPCGFQCCCPALHKCVYVYISRSKRHVWSCFLSVDHGQGTAPVRDSHRWLWGLLSHPAAPHHHLRLSVEVSKPRSKFWPLQPLTIQAVCSGLSLLYLLIYNFILFFSIFKSPGTSAPSALLSSSTSASPLYAPMPSFLLDKPRLVTR